MSKPLSQAIKKIKTWLGNESPKSSIDPHIIGRDQHCISRKNISDAAIKTITGLRKAGFQGFLVGGSVRDLLLDLHPKDFDVATDATPEQVRKVFRNSRIIGRRFKIVHVQYGREIIEVTTFRGNHNAINPDINTLTNNQHSAKSQSGMLLRDNVFGTVEEDAIRRDFTINALYYTTADFAVYDYTNGIQDLKNKTIRIIGDAETRYREDPVRMLRAIRFAAKLGFTIDPATAAPIKNLAHSLCNISAARMFDEVLKLFMFAKAEDTYQLMVELQLFSPLFDQTAKCLKDEHSNAHAIIKNALHNTDERVKSGKPVTPAFIFSALLWPAVQQQQQLLQEQGIAEVPALHQAAQSVLSNQQKRTAIPRRFGMAIREIWDLQLRLPKRSGSKAQQLMENRYFRAAYDFLLLREMSGETTDNLSKWWTDYQLSTPDKRKAMVEKLEPKKRRNKHTRTKTSPKHEIH